MILTDIQIEAVRRFASPVRLKGWALAEYSGRPQ